MLKVALKTLLLLSVTNTSYAQYDSIFFDHYAYTYVNHSSNEWLETSIPKHNFNLLSSYRYTNGWHNGLEYYYMSQMQYLGGENDPQGVHQRVGLSVGDLIKLADNKTIDAQLARNENIDFHQQATADNLIYLEI